MQEIYEFKVSIIVPIYNSIKFLDRCINSITKQDIDNIECILVDDCSTDNSLIICEEYKNKFNWVNIIHNSENQGAPRSREIGLKIAKGQYILFVDSDDWIEQTMVRKMYDKAIIDNLDVVCCDHYSDGLYEKFNITKFDNKVILKQLLEQKLSHNVWNKLVKQNIYNLVNFPKLSWADDKVIIIQTMYYAKEIGYLNEALYHYEYNFDSLSKNKSTEFKRHIERYENWKMIITFLKDKYGSNIDEFEPAISNYTNFIVKYPFLKYKQIRDIEKIFELYPLSFKYIFSKNNEVTILQKLFFYMATKGIIIQFKIMDILWTKKLETIYVIIYDKLHVIYHKIKNIGNKK